MDSCNGLLKFVKLFFCIQLFLNQTNFSIKNTFDLIILKKTMKSMCTYILGCTLKSIVLT